VGFFFFTLWEDDLPMSDQFSSRRSVQTLLVHSCAPGQHGHQVRNLRKTVEHILHPEYWPKTTITAKLFALPLKDDLLNPFNVTQERIVTRLLHCENKC
jgi:hypothetical protein